MRRLNPGNLLAMLVAGATVLPAVAALAQPPAAARIDIVSGTTLGSYLVDASGNPLYAYTKDKSNQSNCYDTCADAWPPVLTTSTPEAATPSLDANLLGTIRRSDGTTQVTYSGHPLYRHALDMGPRPMGQNVGAFGGQWNLVSPAGVLVRTSPVSGRMMR